MSITFSQLGNMGRIGNCLFQLAATVATAFRNDTDYFFPNWEYASHFNLYDCFTDNLPKNNVYKEPFFHYAPIPESKNLDLYGFYQSEKYFADFSNIIISLLTPKIGFGIKYDTTSIHVRRGDYINLTKEYAQLDMDYYKSAMNMINSKNYIVFSDDIAWCKQHFKGDNITFSEGKSPIEDLSLMSSCENQIIANSSFSWWGAYLNMNPSKTVIAPRNWFGPALPHNTKDLIPEGWIKV